VHGHGGLSVWSWLRAFSYFLQQRSCQQVTNNLKIGKSEKKKASKRSKTNWERDPANLICATTDNGSNFLSAFSVLNWMTSSYSPPYSVYLDGFIDTKIQIVPKAADSHPSLVSAFNRSWKKTGTYERNKFSLVLINTS